MWKEAESQEARAISKLVGRVISIVERVVFEKDGAIDEEDYALQLSTAGASIYFWSSPNGETLRVSDTAWVDPFLLPLAPEDQQFVANSGKWVLQSAPDGTPASAIVGRHLVRATPVRDADARLRGVLLQCDNGRDLLYVVSGDEGRIVTISEAERLGLYIDTR